MTQTSRPAATDVTTWPNSDAGPYTSDQWATVWRTIFTGDQQATQGPFIRYLNELQGSVQTPGASPVLRVVTGAAMVNGHWFLSDANVDFTVTAPAANPRIDVIVVAVNNTAVDFAVSDGGLTLDFPDALADYGGDADIEEYSCRLCIVQGVENAAPAVPGLDQNNNHFMIPLYQYQIAVGGATSNETDRRDFCEFSTEVVTAMIADLAVTTAKINDLAVTTAKINDLAVTTNQLGNNVVTYTKMQNILVPPAVLGKPDAGAGDPEEITAGVNDRVLARSGGTIAFQALVPAMVTDRTRKFFVQCAGGFDQTSPADLINQSMLGIGTPDGKICFGYGQFIVPNDFVSGMTATLVVVGNASGNIYSRNECIYGQCGEVNGTHTASVGKAAVAITQFEWECIQAMSLTNAAVGDIVGLEFERDSVDALDTVGNIVNLTGWIIEYTADS